MTVETRKLPIIPPGVGAEIGAGIGSLIPGLGTAIGAEIGQWVQRIYNTFAKIFNKVQSMKRLSKILKGINCALQWYAYLSTIKSGIEFLMDQGISQEKIMELMGLNAVFRGPDIRKEVTDSLASLSTTIKQANEIDRRSRMAPSGLNGIHRPGYHSIAISEVMYEFSNILGSGVMIIIFNPEGFGNKPRAPEIIRYVDESEFSEFIDSESWGNYWRVNYLLKGRKRRAKTMNIEEEDPVTGGYVPQPDSEGLDDYIERALDLPEFADDVIQDEFGEMIIKAFDRQEFLTGEFVKAIEKGNLGRGVEREGLRITSAIQDKWQAVPNNVKRWTATNPIFKDVVGVTAAWKKQLTKMRGLRDTFADARTIGSFKAEALALSNNLGLIGKTEVVVGVVSDFGAKIGAGGAIEATRAGAITGVEYFKGQAALKNAVKLNSDGVLASGFSREQRWWVTDRAEYLQELNDLKPGQAQEMAMAELVAAIKRGERIKIFQSIGKGIFEGVVKPPTCIPFFKD